MFKEINRLLIMALLCFLLLIMPKSPYAQLPQIKQLKQLLSANDRDTVTVNQLSALSDLYRASNNLDSSLAYAQQSYNLAQNIKYEKGLANSEYQVGYILNSKGNYPKALDLLFRSLNQYDEQKNLKGMAKVLETVGSLFDDQNDLQKAVFYAKKAYDIHDALHNDAAVSASAADIGYYFIRMNLADSALQYFQKCFLLANRNKEANAYELSYANDGLGVVNDMLGNHEMALLYFYQALRFADVDKKPMVLATVNQDMGISFEKKNQVDSSIFYYNRALLAAGSLHYPKLVSDIYKRLATMYEKINVKMAVQYYKLEEDLRDSLYSANKANEIQNLLYNEEELHKEKDSELQEDSRQRKLNIQYAGIAIGLIGFTILLLLLSNSILVHERGIEFLGVVGLLVVFEFVNLIVHPYLEHITNNSPIIMLVILVCIAALLVPLHHQLEKWIKHKMVERSNKKKLAFAKKTVERLGKKADR